MGVERRKIRNIINMSKISKNIIKKIREDARKYFINASGCHDWTHVERVLKLAERIGKKEKADLDTIEIAAILHDIGRRDEMRCKGRFCHAERGKKLAEKILKKYGIAGDKADNILHSILAHRSRNNHIPKTREAKAVFDADKLDSLGAVGAARIFLFAGNAGSGNLYTGNEKKIARSKKNYSYTKEDSAILEYEIKLKYIKNNMLTAEGRKIARERDGYLKKYFERFWQEVKAKK